MNLKKIFAVLGVTFLLVSCSKAPISGRRQLMLVSENEIVANSYRQYSEVMNKSFVVENKKSKLVKKVGNRIAKAVNEYFATNYGPTAPQLKYEWEFNLIEDSTPNAWCMPGGKVAVYTGILKYTKNEQGLAVVMSHEIAHAIAQHSREQASQSLVQNLGGLLAASAGINEKIYAGVTNMVMLKYSRAHETEADQLGLIFMKLAGYDPNYAITFWKDMSKASGGQKPIEFLSTHPSDETRIKDIKAYLQSPTFIMATN